jgi:hypothetical protein
VARPATFTEFLEQELRNGRSNASLWKRMLPFRYLFIWAFIVSAFSGLCYGLGVVFVRLLLPSNRYIESADGPTTFVYGSISMMLFFVIAAFLSMVRIIVRVHCLGMGLRVVPL